MHYPTGGVHQSSRALAELHQKEATEMYVAYQSTSTKGALNLSR